MSGPAYERFSLLLGALLGASVVGSWRVLAGYWRISASICALVASSFVVYAHLVVSNQSIEAFVTPVWVTLMVITAGWWFLGVGAREQPRNPSA